VWVISINKPGVHTPSEGQGMQKLGVPFPGYLLQLYGLGL
jgi:hypothetical protein